jgi:phosphonate degradation associated HDIG domain protein
LHNPATISPAYDISVTEDEWKANEVMMRAMNNKDVAPLSHVAGDPAERILALYRERGHMEYEGEGVSQLEHAAQCGALALAAGATPELQLAAWLHDIGHLIAGLPGTPSLEGIDDRHKQRGAIYLSQSFGPGVVGPVALHVAAKRYLVGINPAYYERLSEDSRRSLELQGGRMSAGEQTDFEKQPFYREAIRVRTWDDAAKARIFISKPLETLQRLLTDVQLLERTTAETRGSQTDKLEPAS